MRIEVRPVECAQTPGPEPLLDVAVVDRRLVELVILSRGERRIIGVALDENHAAALALALQAAIAEIQARAVSR